MVRNFLLGFGIFSVVLSILIFSCKIPIGKCKPGASAQGEVQLWGTLPEIQMNAVVQAFNPQARDYAVRYKYVPEAEFNQRLLEALASGTGPDMIMAPYQTILTQASRIMPFPATSFGEKAFRDTYVDGASVLYSPQGALGLPVSVEPMVLFYNRTLFSKHGIITPPAYWDEVTNIVPALTVVSGGRFLESGIALGAPGTSYQKDIMMAIVAQLGQTPVVRIPNQMGELFFSVTANDPVTEGGDVKPLATVLRYLSQYADPGQKTFTWKEEMGDAADLFVGEKLAMYIGYAGEYPTLRARNPRGEFEMTTLPQTKGYNTFATGMRMYAISTLKTTKNPVAALTVESQFAGLGVSPTIAAIVGGVPAARSYAATQGLSPVVAQGMLVARGWYDSYATQSTLYTDAMFSDVINYRYNITDAAALFVGRLRDLYTKN